MARTEGRAVITLTTDFGAADHFVGVMKGVILAIDPDVQLVDLTHSVPPQDVAAAAYQLSNACRYFPARTVHLAVVDPGVGTSRRALVLESGKMIFVAPDNGLLTPFFDEPGARLFEIRDPRFLLPAPSPTFHGRDVFAPAAAHLAAGARPQELGPPVPDPVRLPRHAPTIDGTTIHAHVLHVDGFGNVILDVEGAHLARAGAAAGGSRRLRAAVAGHVVETLVTHYAAARGALCFLINSDGRLEIAQPGGSASRLLGLARGAEIDLEVG